ncbi:MAG: hypothetical protein CMP25_02350 [Rickettsiales bacterium]|nr:hypothetical protein [Rickettsiales bacterium]
MANIPFFDILILALIAVFILNRLRNVLGKKTGNEEDLAKRYSLKTKFEETKPDKEIRLKQKVTNENELSPLHENRDFNKKLISIKNVDPKFDLNNFLSKAKNAFEFILTAYTRNNLKNLEELLDPTIFKDYKKDIEKRIKNNENFEITIIDLKDPEVLNIDLVNKKAIITLKYESQQIHLIKNNKDEVVEGDANQILDISEKWTFSRDLKSKNPNWTLLSIAEI